MPKEVVLHAQNLTVVPANLVEENVEASFKLAGLAVILKDVIGTEWREYAEEGTQTVSRNLLQLARLRRQRDRIIEDVGEEIYGHIESNLHWQVWQSSGSSNQRFTRFARHPDPASRCTGPRTR
jgi:hypothetical protein